MEDTMEAMVSKQAKRDADTLNLHLSIIRKLAEVPGNSIIVRAILLTNLWNMEAVQRGLAKGYHLAKINQKITQYLAAGEDINTLWQD